MSEDLSFHIPLKVPAVEPYSRSPKVGNPTASILQSNVKGILALFVLNPVSNVLGFTLHLSMNIGPSRLQNPVLLDQLCAQSGPSAVHDWMT